MTEVDEMAVNDKGDQEIMGVEATEKKNSAVKAENCANN